MMVDEGLSAGSYWSLHDYETVFKPCNLGYTEKSITKPLKNIKIVLPYLVRDIYYN